VINTVIHSLIQNQPCIPSDVEGLRVEQYSNPPLYAARGAGFGIYRAPLMRHDTMIIAEPAMRLLLILLLTTSLAACGKKGPLEPRPSGALAGIVHASF
jgi:hypothetical protein